MAGWIAYPRSRALSYRDEQHFGRVSATPARSLLLNLSSLGAKGQGGSSKQAATGSVADQQPKAGFAIFACSGGDLATFGADHSVVVNSRPVTTDSGQATDRYQSSVSPGAINPAPGWPSAGSTNCGEPNTVGRLRRGSSFRSSPRNRPTDAAANQPLLCCRLNPEH